MRETAFIAFGSNVGDRVDFCDRAITLLSLLPHSELTGVSALYETEPVNDGREPGPGWFLNGVMRVDTDIAPHSLLAICREIESSLGRDTDARSGPRTMDLDLLFYGSRVITQPELTVPHPRLHERRFVLAPLAELAPDLLHPVLHRSAQALLQSLTDTSVVRALSPQPTLRVYQKPSCDTEPRREVH